MCCRGACLSKCVGHRFDSDRRLQLKTINRTLPFETVDRIGTTGLSCRYRQEQQRSHTAAAERLVPSQGGLCKTLFEEVEGDCGPERGSERSKRPSVVGYEHPPSIAVREGPLDRREQRADLFIVIMLAHVQVPVFWFPDWGGDVIGPDETLVTENDARDLQDRLAL